MISELDHRLRSIPDRFNAFRRWVRVAVSLGAIGLYIGSFLYLSDPLWTGLLVLLLTVGLSAAFVFDRSLKLVPLFVLLLYTQLSDYLSDQYPVWADLLTVLLLAVVSVYILARDADSDSESTCSSEMTEETT